MFHFNELVIFPFPITLQHSIRILESISISFHLLIETTFVYYYPIVSNCHFQPTLVIRNHSLFLLTQIIPFSFSYHNPLIE